MNIREFISEINASDGLADTCRYTVIMTLPNTLTGYDQSSLRRLLLFCEKVQLPGLNLNTTQIRTFGEVREMPYEQNYDHVNMTFYVDGKMIVKKLLDDWIKSCVIGDTRKWNYYNDFICGQMQIYVTDRKDNSKYVVTLYEAYPKSVNSVSMGYDSKDVMRADVTLAFKYWDSKQLGVGKDNNTSETFKELDRQFKEEYRNDYYNNFYDTQEKFRKINEFL